MGEKKDKNIFRTTEKSILLALTKSDEWYEFPYHIRYLQNLTCLQNFTTINNHWFKEQLTLINRETNRQIFGKIVDLNLNLTSFGLISKLLKVNNYMFLEVGHYGKSTNLFKAPHNKEVPIFT